MSCVLFNARSLNSKLQELNSLLHSEQFDILCITESWLHVSVDDSIILNGNNYSLYRADRFVSQRGGGVCVLLNNRRVKGIAVPLPSMFSHLELCVIDLLGDVKIRLFVCYRPPSNNTEAEAVQYVTELCACVDSLMPSNGSIILCGDLNFPSIDWSVVNIRDCNRNTCTGIFLELCHNHGLHQFVDFPTRLNNILDLVLSNDNSCVLNTKPAEPFSTSDHIKVCFDVLYKLPTGRVSYFARDFNRADWSQIKLFLNSVDFFDLFHGDLPAHCIIKNFYDIINACIDSFVPLRCFKISTKSRVINYPYSVRRKLRKKSQAWRVYRAFRTPESLASYRKAASECKSAIYSFTAHYENNLVNNDNIGAFYRYANNKFCTKSSIGPLLRSDGSLTCDSSEKAELLQRIFAHNYTVDNGILPCSDNFKRTKSNLNHIYFTSVSVRRVIKKLRHKTKGGPDGLPPSFFINCCDELCYPLSQFFTVCFECSVIPPVWLTAFITPLFKKGRSVDAANYRPIALTCTMCKLMESIIKDQMVQFLVDKGLINKHQHAFIKNHSTCTNLLESTQDWLVSLHSHLRTDVVYIDFSKAFDSIVISKLLFKLETYGISGHLLKWIGCFLRDRTQCVVVDHCSSSICSVVSGVPQGSVLGPLLFLFFINDIDAVCKGNTTLQLFADDAKLYSSVDFSAHSISLQQSLDNLCAWAEQWQLSINISKCSVLSIASKSHQVSSYYINGISIPTNSTTSDLGVTICDDLTYQSHITNIVSKARQRTSTLMRGFVSRRLDIMRTAFITYIRPILEYNSLVWNPCQVHSIDVLENVQRNFSKRIPSLSSLTYLERLALLNLEPLELRRLRFDLTYYYKILHNLTPFNPDIVFHIYTPPEASRSNSPYLQKPNNATTARLSSFFCRCIDAWNYLPSNLRHAQSTSAFKRAIKCVDLSRFLKGTSVK